jgi:glutathione synthase/RimK-type ligase-like ATP-grasp enzyme
VTKKVFIYSHNFASASARNLSAAGVGKRIRHESSKFTGDVSKTVINWGSSNLPNEVVKCNVLNHPDTVGRCTNKLSFFEFVKNIEGVCIPEFTTKKDVAKSWVEDGKGVFARTKLQGSGGDGIVDMNGKGVEVVDAPLYVMYIPKRAEYRVHYMGGDIIHIGRKGKRDGGEGNYRIQNLDNGFVYMRNDDRPVPDCVEEQVDRVAREIGLDFFAADIIYNEYRNKAYILEVNTAPGLEGSLLDIYSQKLKELTNA